MAPWVFSWENLLKDLTGNSIPEDTKVHMHSGHFNKLNDTLLIYKLQNTNLPKILLTSNLFLDFEQNLFCEKNWFVIWKLEISKILDSDDLLSGSSLNHRSNNLMNFLTQLYYPNFCSVTKLN